MLLPTFQSQCGKKYDMGHGAGQLAIWHRKKRLDSGLPVWKPRIMLPYYYITNRRQVARLMEFDLGRVRSCDDNRLWDFDMDFDTFRTRIEALSERVLRSSDQAAFKTDARVRVQLWETMQAHHEEGPFTERWVYWDSFYDQWDVTAADEHVGDDVFENRPFQMEHG